MKKPKKGKGSHGQQRKKCFVVGPIGQEGSDSRNQADWLLEAIVKPAISDSYEVFRADGITIPGMIDGQIINNLIDADLVIADMSELNPNVFYEMGIRHCTKKPIIHMINAEGEIPFDVKPYRAIVYSIKSPARAADARRQLIDQVRETEKPTFKSATPVQIALQFRGLLESQDETTSALAKVVLDLTTKVQALEGRELGRQSDLELLLDDSIARQSVILANLGHSSGKSKWINALRATGNSAAHAALRGVITQTLSPATVQASGTIGVPEVTTKSSEQPDVAKRDGESSKE